jgi:pilus assembly protein CpaE
VARIVLERGYDRGGKPAGRVVALMGAKGGVGATFVTTQLAAGLQARGGRSVVVDLNYPLGDVALHLDVHPQHTLADVARQGSSLDAVFLKSALERHRSGVQVLAAPNRLEDAELLTGECVDQSLQLLRNDFDWVLLDASRAWNDANAQAFAWADQILLVASLDVPTLNHAKQNVDLFKRLGHSDERIRAVVNRFSSWDTVTQSDFESFVGRAPDARIPNDYATAVSCLNQGRTVAEIAAGGPLHRAFLELARGMYEWCGLEPQTGTREPAGDKLKARLRRMLGGR